MKTKRFIKFIACASVVLMATGIFACTELDEMPPEPGPSLEPIVENLAKTIHVSFVNDQEVSISDLDVDVYLDGEFLISKKITQELDYEVSQRGNYRFVAKKADHIDQQKRVRVDYENDTDGWAYDFRMMLTKASPAVAISATKATLFEPENNSVPAKEKLEVTFPAGATGGKGISVSMTAIKKDESNTAVESNDGVVALRSFDFSSDGVVKFEKPVELKVGISEEYKGYLKLYGYALAFKTKLENGNWEENIMDLGTSEGKAIVEINHFSKWIMTPSMKLELVSTSKSEWETFKGKCGENLTVNYSKTVKVEKVLELLLGIKPNTISYKESFGAITDRYKSVKIRCTVETYEVLKYNDNLKVYEQIGKKYISYLPIFEVRAEAISCGIHSGGGGS